MFLTTIYILGPITAVRILIVQQTANAQLFSCSSIPACPVACTRCFVSENAIQPVTMFG